LSVGDIDGSGKPSILLSAHRQLFAIDRNGQVKWVYRYDDGQNHDLSNWARYAAYDLDGDGVPEVILSTWNQVIFLDGRTGVTKATFDITPANIGTTAIPSYAYSYVPIVADVDNDGHADVLFTWTTNSFETFNNIAVLRAQNNDWRPAPITLNEMGFRVTNVEPNGAIPAEVPVPNNFADPRTNVFANTGLHLADQKRLTSQLDLLYDDYGSVWAVGCPHLLAFARRENFLPYALLIDEKVQEYMVRDTQPGRAYLPLRNGKLPGVILSSRKNAT